MSRGQVENAKAEMSECEGCTGRPCRKVIPYYRVVYKGKIYVLERCEYADEPEEQKPVTSPKKNNAMKMAQVPTRYIGKTFSDYETTPDNHEALQIAHWYLEDKPTCSLYFYGEVGTGKTLLASIMAQELINEGQKVIFGDVPSLLDRIKATFNSTDNAQDVLNSYFECDLLILDDFGAGQITDWNVGVMYQIINRRYNEKKPVVITSNLDLNGLENRLASKDALTAKRITSRINEMCELAFFGLKDRRKTQ